MNITQSFDQSLGGTGRYDHDSLFDLIGLKTEGESETNVTI
jgi:hypothetical protein